MCAAERTATTFTGLRPPDGLRSPAARLRETCAACRPSASLQFATVARVRRSTLFFALLALALAACDRNLEPFDPNEQPHEPDLSKIFPEGADSAEPAQPGLPPAP